MEFNKPGPNKRVCAFLIDASLAQIVSLVLCFSFQQNVTWVITCIILLLKDTIDGQGPGKAFVGLRAVNESNEPASPGTTILRNVTMILPIVPLIEYFVMLSDKETGRRLGDRMAKSKVNDLKPEIKDSQYFWISLGLALVYLFVYFGLGYLLYISRPHASL